MKTSKKLPALYKEGGAVSKDRLSFLKEAAQNDSTLTGRDKRRLAKGFARMEQATEGGGAYISAAPGLYKAVDAGGIDIVGKNSGRKVGKAMAYLRDKQSPTSVTTATAPTVITQQPSTQQASLTSVSTSTSANPNALKQSLIDDAEKLYNEQQASKPAAVEKASTKPTAGNASPKVTVKRNTKTPLTSQVKPPIVSLPKTPAPVFNNTSASGQVFASYYDDGKMQMYPNGRFMDSETGFMGTKNESGYVYDEPRTNRRAKPAIPAKAIKPMAKKTPVTQKPPVVQVVKASDALNQAGRNIKKAVSSGVSNFSGASTNQNRNQAAIRDYYKKQREQKFAVGGGIPSSSGLDEFGAPILDNKAKGIAQLAQALNPLGLGNFMPQSKAAPGIPSASTIANGQSLSPKLLNDAEAIYQAQQPTTPASNNSDNLNREINYQSRFPNVFGGIKSLFQKDRLGIDKQVDTSGSGTKRGLADYANLGLGAYGLASVLTAKKPKLAAPSRYTSMINPATGLPEAQVNQARADISANARLASRPQGSDGAANMMQRLAVNANTNRAFTDLNTANATAYKGDLQRVADQTNQDRQFNYGNQRAFQEGQYNEQMQQFQARQQAGQAMAQNALNYEQQRSQDINNKGVDERMANNRLGMMNEGDMHEYRNSLIQSGMPIQQVEAVMAQRAANNPYAKYQTNNYQRRRNGGKINLYTKNQA